MSAALDHGQAGSMVVLDPPTVNYVPVDQGTQHMKTVPPRLQHHLDRPEEDRI